MVGWDRVTWPQLCPDPRLLGLRRYLGFHSNFQYLHTLVSQQERGPLWVCCFLNVPVLFHSHPGRLESPTWPLARPLAWALGEHGYASVLSVLMSLLEWETTFVGALSRLLFRVDRVDRVWARFTLQEESAFSGRGHTARTLRHWAQPVCQARTPHRDARWQQGHSSRRDMSRLPSLKTGALKRPPIFFTPLGRKMISAGFVCPRQYSCL